MAYNDLAQFLPQEGGFKTPGQYDRMLKTEALKKAAYLSSMDQFYSQLEETMRQFDLGLGQKKKEFLNLLDLRRDYRNLEYGKMGLDALGLGVNAFLKNKDITYAFEWIDQKWPDLFGHTKGSIPEFDQSIDLGNYDNIFEGFGTSGDYDLGVDLDFDLPEYNF
jgi:hypothetical protein